MASSKSGHPESNQGPSDLCKLYSQMPYQLSYSRLDTLSHFCVCRPCGAMENLEKKTVTLLCVSSLRGHGNLARRIKLTQVTKENLRLKILEVRGHLVLGTPAIVLEGPHLAKKPSYSHLGSITWDSMAERSKAVAQGAIP